MLVSGAACGEAANLVDDHDGSYWIDEEEFIAVCVEKQYLKEAPMENLLKVKEGQNLFHKAIEIHTLVGSGGVKDGSRILADSRLTVSN